MASNGDACEPTRMEQEQSGAPETEPESALVTDPVVTNGTAVTPFKSTRSGSRVKAAATPTSSNDDSLKKNGASNGSAKQTSRNKQSSAAPHVEVNCVPERRLVVFPASERIKCTRAELMTVADKIEGTDFVAGDIVWAKTTGFPFWPCLITTDPLEAVYAKTDSSGDLVYHFQFFGTEAARAWAKARNIFEFKGVDKYRALSEASTTGSARKSRGKQHDKYAVDVKHRKKWEYAAAEATFAKQMSVEERLSAFTFDYKIEEEGDVSEGRKRKSETPKTPVGGPARKRSKKASSSPEDVFDFNDEDEMPETPTTLVKETPLLLSSAKKKGDLTVYKKREKSALKKANPKMSDSELEALLEKKWGLMDEGQRAKYVDRSDAEPKEADTSVRLSHGTRTVKPKTPAILIAKKTPASERQPAGQRVSDVIEETPKKAPKPVTPKATPALKSALPTKAVRTPKGKSPTAAKSTVSSSVTKKEKSDDSKPQFDQESQSDEVQSVASASSEEVISVSDVTSESGSEITKPVTAEVCHKCYEKIEPGVDAVKCAGPCLRFFEKKCIAVPADESAEDWKCPECTSSSHPCFICNTTPAAAANGPSATVKCSDPSCGRFYHPSCLKSHPHKMLEGDSFTCPLHICLSCHNDHYEDNVFRTVKRPLLTCIKCPTAYHLLDDCVAAGTAVVVPNKYIICPEHQEKKKSSRSKHVNVSFCFACMDGGKLTCCDRCPAAFHAECLESDFKIDAEKEFLCGSCLKRRQLRYGDIVWVKIGAFRWWPAKIVHPMKTPDNVMRMKWTHGQFPVIFFGTNDYNWTEQARAFPYEEGDSRKPLTSHGSSKTDKDFKKALQEAKDEYTKYKEEKSSALAKKVKTFPPYNRIRTNRAIGKVQLQDDDETSGPTNKCECDPNSDNPCSSETDCLNRMMMYECNGKNCKVGDKCRNQRFKKREYIKAKPFNTVQRGWGLRTQEDINKGQFVIEYVGEIIDEKECERRLADKTVSNDSNFYFLTIDKDRIIDAGPSGNLARFMNHSCQPNCETQKWVVNGSTRIGLFAVEDIPKGTELTFHYNLDCRGKPKSVCTCGAKNCSGFL